MSDTPVWIQTLSALLTPTIAGAVGVIGFMQWRTAHQKVMLDLFDRRLKVFETAKSAASIVSAHGRGDNQAEFALLTAINESKFLFGDDVQRYLDEMWENYVNMQALVHELEALDKGPLRTKAVRDRTMYALRITSFYTKGAEVFAPYMKMDQRRVRTPGELFRDCNRERLSYADEKQR